MHVAPVNRDQREAHPQAWPALALLWVAFFLNQADRQVLPGVLPLLKADFGLDSGQLGLLNSSFHWVFAACVPIAGWIADNRSRRRVIIGALVAWSVTTGLSGLASSFMFLVLMRAATGAGEACYLPAANSLLTDLHAKQNTGLALSIHQSANYVGVACAGALAGWIGERLGWHSAFLSFGTAGVVVAAVLAWRLPNSPHLGAQNAGTLPLRERLHDVLRVPSFYWLSGAFLGMLLVNTAYLAWMPTLLHERFELSLPAAGFHAAIYHQIGAFIGVLVGGKLSDAWTRRSVLGRPFTQLVGLTAGIPFVVALGLADQKLAVYAALGIFGVCRGLFDSCLFTSLFAVMPARVRGFSSGLFIAIAFLGGGFAPWLVGLLAKTQGLGPALAWSASGYGLGVICLTAACLRHFREDARHASQAT